MGRCGMSSEADERAYRAELAMRWDALNREVQPMLKTAAKKLAPRDPNGNPVMSMARKQAQERRRKRLYEYEGKGQADAIMAHIAAVGPVPTGGAVAFGRKLLDTAIAAGMMRERPERPEQVASQAPGRMREAAGRGATT